MSDIKTLKNSRQYRIIQVCGVALTLHSKNKPLLNANLCFCKANDIDKILALQDKARSAMKQKEWFAHTSRAELEAAFERGYPAVAVICGEKMIAFAYLILSPDNGKTDGPRNHSGFGGRLPMGRDLPGARKCKKRGRLPTPWETSRTINRFSGAY